MHDSVKAIWHAFSQPLEGRTHSMYVDVKNLVTCGVGNLIDPVGLALQLPWKHESTGTVATPAEVTAAWSALKNHPGLPGKDGKLVPLPKLHFKYAAKLNDLRLTDEDIDALVEKKLHEFEAHLQKHHFPEFDLFPADAQLGILSMSWACGPGFPATFKNFKRAALARDWVAAKATCDIRTESNPGVVPRNTNNRRCFLNAATVHDRGLDPSILYWPNEAPLDGPIAPPLSDSDRARIEALRAEHVHDLFEMNQRDKHDTEPPDTEPDPSPPESAA